MFSWSQTHGAAPNCWSCQTNKRQCYHSVRNKYSKPTARAICDWILLLLQRGWRPQLLSQYCTILTVLSHGVDWEFDFMIIYCPTVSVTWRMLKLCENGSNFDYLYETSSFEKSHGNRNLGFDLLASVRFRFLKTETEPKFGFRTSLLCVCVCVCVCVWRCNYVL